MNRGKIWGIIIFVLIILGFGIWLYTSSSVKEDVSREGVEIINDETLP